MTMTLVSTVTVGSGGAASIDFTSIPAATDLYVVMSIRAATLNGDALRFKFNNTTTGYTLKQLYGTGSSAGSFSDTAGYLIGMESTGATANTFNNVSLYVPNYAGSTNKSWSSDGVRENNATAAEQVITAGLWSNTSAITSLSIYPASGGATNFAQYSTASLYTITKGSGGATVS